MNTPPSTVPEPFRSAFCRVFGCRPEAFETTVLRRCFPLWSRPLGALMLALNPRTFRRELGAISQLGRATDESQIKAELDSYVYETVRDRARFRTRTLGLRLSRRRFFRLVQAVRSATPSVEGNQPKGSPPPVERENAGGMAEPPTARTGSQ